MTELETFARAHCVLVIEARVPQSSQETGWRWHCSTAKLCKRKFVVLPCVCVLYICSMCALRTRRALCVCVFCAFAAGAGEREPRGVSFLPGNWPNKYFRTKRALGSQLVWVSDWKTWRACLPARLLLAHDLSWRREARHLDFNYLAHKKLYPPTPTLPVQSGTNFLYKRKPLNLWLTFFACSQSRVL